MSPYNPKKHLPQNNKNRRNLQSTSLKLGDQRIDFQYPSPHFSYKIIINISFKTIPAPWLRWSPCPFVLIPPQNTGNKNGTKKPKKNNPNRRQAVHTLSVKLYPLHTVSLLSYPLFPNTTNNLPDKFFPLHYASKLSHSKSPPPPLSQRWKHKPPAFFFDKLSIITFRLT
jgi:hypothetical protein